MTIERLNRGEAEKAMSEWIENYPKLPQIALDYTNIRNDLSSYFEMVQKKACETDHRIQDYYTDTNFGILLYTYFQNQKWFTLRLASDDGFWRYLSVKVIPNVVAARWGKENESHYWSTPGRIWLKQLWWYVYLSWKNDVVTTRRIIESPNCSTDTILNFVERTGRKGTCVEAYRWIIFFYSTIPSDVLSNYNKTRKTDLFRVVMKLNTARMMVLEPNLCLGGCEGYAKKLFIDSGINIDSLSY